VQYRYSERGTGRVVCGVVRDGYNSRTKDDCSSLTLVIPSERRQIGEGERDERVWGVGGGCEGVVSRRD
jgi:hypothetical protein